MYLSVTCCVGSVFFSQLNYFLALQGKIFLIEFFFSVNMLLPCSLLKQTFYYPFIHIGRFSKPYRLLRALLTHSLLASSDVYIYLQTI